MVVHESILKMFTIHRSDNVRVISVALVFLTEVKVHQSGEECSL